MSLTKVVVTVGPATEEVSTLVSLIKAGARVFRFNLKHADYNWHSLCIKRVEKASKIAGTPVAILLDLQGPEIRIGKVPDQGVRLKKSSTINFTKDKFSRSENIIPISKPFFQLPLKRGDKVYIDQGKIEIQVLRKKKNKISAKVIKGGRMQSQKGVNIPGMQVRFNALLAKDIKDLSLAAKHEIDYLALSFVRNKKDIVILRKQVEKISPSIKVLAKIETKEALENFEEILKASDGIIIARGDLGMEIPFEQVPYYQKKIIRRCAEVGKPVITATQMMESMCESPFPTRAEVSDVANSVLDYTDAVMFSRETATGKYPKKTILATDRICSFWEKKRPPVKNFNYELNHQTASICYSAYELWMSPFCQREKVKAFVAVTKTGMTAWMLSRLRPNLPILAITDNKRVKDHLCLLYGVTPMLFKEKGDLYKKRNSSDIEKILKYVKKTEYVKKGEKVIIIYSEDWKTKGKTGIIRIQEIP